MSNNPMPKSCESEAASSTPLPDEQQPKSPGGGKKRRTFRDVALASSRQFRQSFTDSARRIRKQVSQPIKERSLNKFMERVMARKERRSRQSSDSMQLRDSEDAFPLMGVSADSVVKEGPPTEKSERSDIPSEKSSRSEKEPSRSSRSTRKSTDSSKSEMKKIFPDVNKQNSKREKKKKLAKSIALFSARRKAKEQQSKIFIDGQPFWMKSPKISQQEKNEITQDDLPLNAEIILDVKKKKIELPVVPSNLKIKFDAYAPMETLRSRDAILFTPKMLFANTIRSMINTTDDIAKTLDSETNTDIEKTGEKKTEHDDFDKEQIVYFTAHPTYSICYKRDDPGANHKKEPFTWKGIGVT